MTRSLTHIFHYTPWNERVPFTLRNTLLGAIVSAETKVIKWVSKLKILKNHTSNTFKARHERVHASQRILLQNIYRLYLCLDASLQTSKEYRNRLPMEDRRELVDTFSENILFAAQALVGGFRVRGIERYTTQLFQPAMELCAIYDALRYVLHSRALCNLQGPYEDLFSILIEFDAAWSRFESYICDCYYMVNYSTTLSKLEHLDYFQILMSETIAESLEKQWITFNQLEEYDPEIVFVIPRLTLLKALLNPSELFNLTDPIHSFMWFRHRCQELDWISRELQELDAFDVIALESSLAQHTINLNDRIQGLFRLICTVSDELQSGRSSEFSALFQRVLQMYQ